MVLTCVKGRAVKLFADWLVAERAPLDTQDHSSLLKAILLA